MNIDKLTIKQMYAMRQQVISIIDRKRAKTRPEARRACEELARSYGFTLREVVAKGATPRYRGTP
jgi:predicted kinase